MNHKDIPSDFRHCVVDGCCAADHCLRHQAYEHSENEDTSFWIINPKAAQPEAGEECPHYLDAAPVRMARGFLGALASVPSANVHAVRAEISAAFCQRTYYTMRRGERAMSPAEQRIVAAALERNGAKSPVEFDSYYEALHWM